MIQSVSRLWWRRNISRNATSWQELDEFPELSPAEQRRDLARRLLAQIQHFGKRADALPEWREAAKITLPDDLWDIWPSLPIIGKPELKTKFIAEETAAVSGLPGRVSSTGGSTGEAVRFYHDSRTLFCIGAAEIYSRVHMGWHMGMPTIVVWGAERDIQKPTPLKDTVYQSLLNQFWVAGYHMTDDTARRVATLARRHRPVAIYGFTSMLQFVAERAVERGYDVSGCVRVAWNGGEMLSDAQRELFRKVFGTPILNRYGGRELGCMACQFTEAEPLRVLRPWQFVEIVDEKGKPVQPGESGRLIWTSTICRGTPFLRFDIGDLGSSYAQHQDESGIFALSELHGRFAGLLQLPDGTRINNLFWNHLFKEFAEVRQFQVVVRRAGDLRILLNGTGFSDAREHKLRGILNSFLGAVPFTIEWVERIPVTSMGKLVQVVRESS